jgi:hypothetical protein
MPHYYFDIKDGHGFVDPAGLDFKNDHDAIERAKVIAIGFSIDKPEVDPTRHISFSMRRGSNLQGSGLFQTGSRIVTGTFRAAMREASYGASAFTAQWGLAPRGYRRTWCIAGSSARIPNGQR